MVDKTSQQLEVVSTGVTDTASRTLIVLGHGSHLNADSAQAVRRHAQAVRERGLFGEVLEAYWKEEPSLRQVLRLARSRDVTVVPLFVSEGYFTNQVLPRELGLTWRGPLPPQGVREVVDGRQLHYTRPYGIHPAMSDVILARAAEVYPDWTPQDTALVVLGHGTGRDPHSREAIEQAADRLRQGGHFAEVQALYLDQEPNVADWPSLTCAPTVVIVPFFASEGWHTLETIPADLGLSGPVTRLGGRTVCYSRPVGTHPAVTEVVLRLVEDSAETEDTAARTAPAQIHPDWQAAGETLAQALTSGSGLRVGELHITPLPEGGFHLCHQDDVGRADLRAVPLQDLSAWTGRSDEGHHRPIRTGRTLPRGWFAAVDAAELRAALHAVYPAVLEQAHLWEQGKLPVTPWPETATRQSGRYARVRRAPPEQVAQARHDLCSGCLRTPLWAGEPPAADAFPLPCPEACTLLVSHVRQLFSGEIAHA